MAKINIFLREKILNEAAQQKLKIVIFYTEMMRKVVLWCFFMSEMSEKNPQLKFNFLGQNLNVPIFSKQFLLNI